jgi:hypothetical protein
MKILHILRSEPDETVEKLTVSMSMEDTASVVMLYEDARRLVGPGRQNI